VAGDRAPVSTPGFWDRLYAASQDGWELGAPAPSLVARLEAGIPVAPGAHFAVPGAGRGHDARLLARRGYAVTAFDFAEAAITDARTLAEQDGVRVAFQQRDVFGLGTDFAAAFDAAWEYTCFCAIDPDRRQEYARVLRDILKPGGVLLACFYPLKDGSDGPPFPVSRVGIEATLSPHFDILEAGPPAASPERRQGLEWLVTGRRRAS